MANVPSIPEAVGGFLAGMRREHEITLDQIAQSGRRHGARWSASSVSNIEKGQASLTLPTLLYLALALSDFTERPLRLQDLLGDAKSLKLGEKHEFTRDWFDRMLSGEEVAFAIDDMAWIDDVRKEQAGDSPPVGGLTDEQREGHFRQLVEESQIPPEPRVRRRRDGSLAEERAAQRIGIAVNTLQEVARDLWGRSLEDEARHRAGVGSTPQARGRVTRTLVAEIREKLQSD